MTFSNTFRLPCLSLHLQMKGAVKDSLKGISHRNANLVRKKNSQVYSLLTHKYSHCDLMIWLCMGGILYLHELPCYLNCEEKKVTD